MSGEGVFYDISRRKWAVRVSFSADEARDLAYLYGPNDGAFRELTDWADEADALNSPEGRLR